MLYKVGRMAVVKSRPEYTKNEIDVRKSILMILLLIFLRNIWNTL
jgi:hypothetical protein